MLILVVTWKDEAIKGARLGLRQFLATESPLKMMKNVFYFTFSFSRYSNFSLDVLVM